MVVPKGHLLVKQGLDPPRIPVCSRSLGSSAPLMEEILRWGTQDLFQARRDSEGNTAVQSREADGASAMEGVEGGASLRDDAGNSDSGRPVKAAQVRTSSRRNHGCADRACCATRPAAWIQCRLSCACNTPFCKLSTGRSSRLLGCMNLSSWWSVQALNYADEGLNVLLEKAAEISERAALMAGADLPDSNGDAAPVADFGPGLEHVAVQEWADEKEEGVDAEAEGAFLI